MAGAEKKMKGHARERRPGVWELRAYVGRDPLSNRKRTETKTVYGKFTQRQADELANEFAVELGKEPIDSSDLTFGELLERWFAIAAPRMVPAGRKETRGIIDTRLAPLAELPLTRIAARTGTAVLDEFYAALRERGGRCRLKLEKCSTYPCDHGGGAPLSDSTVVRTHVVVRAALEQAVKWGLIARNPAAHAYAGEPDPPEIEPPKPEDVVRIFELAEEEDPELVVFLVLSSTTGQRRGAVSALRWEDLDLERGIAEFGHVLSLGPDGVERVKRGRGKRNNKGSKNRVPLDPTVVAILLAHRARCEALAELAGVPFTGEGYVFAADGIGLRPWRPDSISRRFRRLRNDADLDETRLHDLRHFVVTYLRRSGVELDVVKKLVGHSRMSTTTEDVYDHLDLETRREATGILARLLKLDGAPAPDLEPEPEPSTSSSARRDEDQGAKIIPLRRRNEAS